MKEGLYKSNECKLTYIVSKYDDGILATCCESYKTHEIKRKSEFLKNNTLVKEINYEEQIKAFVNVNRMSDQGE